MPEFLGIDTSNYTTSAAVYNSDTGEVFQSKKLLPVQSGKCGLRQSDAVFHHTVQISSVMKEILEDHRALTAAGVSVRPRNIEGSYMPCFLVGKAAAEILSFHSGCRLYTTSHQLGHIAAALYSCKRLDLLEKRFIAFHVSGGTTDCLICQPDDSEVINAQTVGTSLDLKAGQAIDRIGVKMGLDFPCGKHLESLAAGSDVIFSIKIKLKGNDCCLSGLENQCEKMLGSKKSFEDTALYCLSFIGKTVKAMTQKALDKYGDMPVVCCGGVMSDSIIKKMLENEFDAYFAMPEFSCDNAVGAAVLASEKYKRKL